MLVARNEESHKELARMVKAREVLREYTALVEGRLESRTGTIDAPRRHRQQRTKQAVKGRDRGRRGLTRRDRDVAGRHLVHARLETGAAPDPRALRRDRHPVVGDPEYGARGAMDSSASSCTLAVALHAPQHRQGDGVHLELRRISGRLRAGAGGLSWRVCHAYRD